jgi:hypothetical protein
LSHIRRGELAHRDSLAYVGLYRESPCRNTPSAEDNKADRSCLSFTCVVMAKSSDFLQGDTTRTSGNREMALEKDYLRGPTSRDHAKDAMFHGACILGIGAISTLGACGSFSASCG